ncbi:MAG: Stk1 family PASTA domain-containing Ser/Thr kinase [Hespellia sp.]|nr:Stk1 family PASTA domain-containing Ser/Thr kinase [Hespellia sp.]
MLKTGVFLGKRYEIIERVGSGGMADVYKGKDHKLNRYVAIKVLKSDFRADEEFIRKFHSEAQAAAGLMHPNVVNVYDVGEDRGLHYMVMELVEGITLKDYIEKKGRLSAKETISISIQMATGIEAAHNQHIIHRDIKPANIIISKEGKVKVTDFGIARATTAANTISSNVMGSVHYTSPEQARGGGVDIKSDIYSAGITMYEMVTGHVPFDGDSTVSIAIKHLQEEIVSPAEEVPDIPYSLECIILKCTQKNPEKRYPNAGALIQDLKQSLVDPDGDFVTLGVMPDHSQTVMITEDELERIKQQEEYEDDYEDEDYDDDEELDEDVNPKMAKVMKILMIVVAVIIAFAVIFMIGRAAGVFKIGNDTSSTSTESKVKVPKLVGLTKEEAIKALNDKNLGYDASEKPSDKYEKGIVMEQKTKEGERVDKNTRIKIVISTGKTAAEVTVPDVKGKDEADAQKALEDAKLVVESATAYDDTVEEGKVISTSPAGGTKAKEGDKVTMKVSLGAEKATVPDLRGKSQSDANEALSSAGLGTGTVTEDYSDDYAAGTVISQGTSPNKKVAKGTTVDYVISKGAKTVSVTVPNLSGKMEDGARSALSSAGLSVGDVTSDYSSTVTAGYVISQTIGSGTSVDKGTAVGFVISLGPKPSTDPDDGDDNGGNTGNNSTNQ